MKEFELYNEINKEVNDKGDSGQPLTSFLKWVGRKRQILVEIERLVPKEYDGLTYQCLKSRVYRFLAACLIKSESL